MASFVSWLKDFVFMGSTTSTAAQPTRSSATKTEVRAKPVRTQRKGNEVSSIETVTPSSYAEAGAIAEVLRESVPVIVNVQNLSEPEVRRLIDFMSGLKSGLQAESKRVAEHVYLLAPFGVDIDGDTDDILEDDSNRLIIRP